MILGRRGRLFADRMKSAFVRGQEVFVGLFDVFGYPAFGASLRLLGANYTGSAVRVRRSSDDAEQDIGFVDNELDTASLLSFVGVGDGFVTTWYDQSGNGNDATQSTAANQPKIVDAGALILEGGKPTLKLDGVDDFLKTTSRISLNDVSAFQVVRSTGAITSVYPLVMQDDNDDGFRFHYFNPYFRVRYEATNADNLNVNLSDRNLFRGYVGASLITNICNNLTPFSIATTQQSSNPFLEIGSLNNVPATNKFEGVIQETIVYNENIISEDNNISSNINNYFNIYS